jgi:hypothetical protein
LDLTDTNYRSKHKKHNKLAVSKEGMNEEELRSSTPEYFFKISAYKSKLWNQQKLEYETPKIKDKSAIGEWETNI